LAGVGLAQLQQYLDLEFPHRESHSTLGSTFLNPTTAAGVAFGSGGTQVRKGPAYTERALYLKIHQNKWKEFVVETVNTLGIAGMEDDDELLTSQTGRQRKMDSIPSRLDTWSRWIQGGFERQMKHSKKESPHGRAPASDVDYAHRLCQHTDKDTVSRYNADTRGPDPNRSEGKVIILATVHDTFLKPRQTKTFWISFNSLETALKFRRHVCLSSPQDLPVSMEYMDRDSFDIIDRAGRFMAKTIQLTGTSSSIVQQLWKVKLWVEALPFASAPLWGDYAFYYINPIVPSVLPSQVAEMGRSMDHHVALTMGDYGNGEMERFMQRLDKFVQEQNGDDGGEEKIQLFECTKPSQTKGLTAFRFVAATAFRTWCVGNGMQGISVDYALPKTNGGSKPPLMVAKTSITKDDDGDGDTQLVAVQPIKRMRYSHFGCNVVHEDLAYAPGVDVEAAKHAFKQAVEELSAGKLPAEHGHGTEYHAPRETQERWKRMDPLNVLNPGIGGMSDKFKYKE
jgi:D-lactate dehydrogenase (quinone)